LLVASAAVFGFYSFLIGFYNYIFIQAFLFDFRGPEQIKLLTFTGGEHVVKAVHANFAEAFDFFSTFAKM